MNRNTQVLKTFLVLSFLLVLIFSGCTLFEQAPATEEATPGEGTATTVPQEKQCSILRLPDNSELYISPDTEIEFVKLAGLTPDATGHEIVMMHGRILVVSQLPDGEWFTITGPQGQVARVTNSIMVVEYDKDVGDYVILCVSGECELGKDIQNLFLFETEDKGWLDEDGNVQGPEIIDLDELAKGCGGKVVFGEPTAPATTEPPTNTPEPTEETETPVPTSDMDATATAECQEFEEENPGTPCP